MLGYGQYHDAARPLRRLLKQVGGGSAEMGCSALLANEGALAEAAALTGIDPKVWAVL